MGCINRIKTLRVIGENVGQMVIPVTETLAAPAASIVNVQLSLSGVTDHVFPGKVIKQGSIVKQVFYVSTTTAGTVLSQTFTIPFALEIPIPNLNPSPNLVFDVQNEIVTLQSDFTLIPPTTLVEKILLVVRARVSVEDVLDVEVRPRGAFVTQPRGQTVFTFIGAGC